MFFRILCIALLTVSAHALPVDEARHLLLRTGFGATNTEVTALLGLNREAAVRAVMGMNGPALPPPAWVHEPLKAPEKNADEVSKKAARKAEQVRFQELQEWYLASLVSTTSPLQERMVLFWHNHFTSEQRKVNSSILLYTQHMLFEKLALGSFAELLRSVAEDPAMILYLDNQTNSRGKPNENFARELLELFTLGEGHYTETDIKEAARAFTGWRVDKSTGTFRFEARIHDDGPKTFLGTTGNWDGSDIIKIVLVQPRTAEYITEKLWREFVSPIPDPAEIQKLASAFRSNNYEISGLIEGLLREDAFWSSDSRLTLVKSPVELLVGTVRTLGIKDFTYREGIRALAGMGQELFNPINVKGWPTGDAWLSSDTLLLRRKVLAGLYRDYRSQAATGKTDLALTALLDPSFELK